MTAIQTRGAILDVFMRATVGSKGYTYNGDGWLDKIQVYADSAMTELVFTEDYTYNGDGTIDTMTLTREGDGAQWRKSYTYDVGVLVSITVAPLP